MSRRSRVALLVLGVVTPVALFLLLAEGVAGGVVRGVDEGTLRALEQIHGAPLTAFMRGVTFLGGDWGVAVPTVAAAVVLLVVCRPRLRDALFTVVVVAGAGLLQFATKPIFERPRPDVVEPLVTVATSSYPSGHAMASASLALAIGILAWPTRWRAATVIAGTLFVLAVGVSRVYLGVHYPSDIVAGWLLADAWTVAVWLLFAAVGRRPGPAVVRADGGG